MEHHGRCDANTGRTRGPTCILWGSIIHCYFLKGKRQSFDQGWFIGNIIGTHTLHTHSHTHTHTHTHTQLELYIKSVNGQTCITHTFINIMLAINFFIK